MRTLLLLLAGVLTLPLIGAERHDHDWHLRLSCTGDMARSATVSFDVDGTAPAALALDTQAHEAAADYAQRLEPQRSGQYRGHGDQVGTALPLRYHHVRLSGLEPDTVYHFRLIAGERASRDFHFRTLPAAPERLRFIQGGDSRTRHEPRQQLNDLIRKLSAEGAIDFLAHGGDFVSRGQYFEDWLPWLVDHQRTITDDGRVLVMIPAQGNHEGWPPPRSLYWEVFDVEPPGYYLQRFGDLLAFVTLNTEIPTGGDQARWLAEALPDARTARWLYAQYHRPAFPAIKRPSGARKDWVPLFEKYRVDVVYECDGHNYKVLPPIRGESFDPQGVLYIGEGGWGAPQRDRFNEEFYTEPPAVMAAVDHLMLIEVQRDTLSVSGLAVDGTVFHKLVYPTERAERMQAVEAQEFAPER